jgi:hypothetical protein
MPRGLNAAKRVPYAPQPYTPLPKSKQRDVGYLFERYQRIAARSDPRKPRTEDAADIALADLIIAIVALAGPIPCR